MLILIPVSIMCGALIFLLRTPISDALGHCIHHRPRAVAIRDVSGRNTGEVFSYCYTCRKVSHTKETV